MRDLAQGLIHNKCLVNISYYWGTVYCSWLLSSTIYQAHIYWTNHHTLASARYPLTWDSRVVPWSLGNAKLLFRQAKVPAALPFHRLTLAVSHHLTSCPFPLRLSPESPGHTLKGEYSQGSILCSLIFLLLLLLVGKFRQALGFSRFPFILTYANLSFSDLIFCLFVLWCPPLVIYSFEESIVLSLGSSFKMQVIMKS